MAVAERRKRLIMARPQTEWLEGSSLILQQMKQ